ncbi:hypothetical protein ACFXG4_27345 [Nocardia sp. NPDC059246]|uniref:hypothetical protein n=1 Tax=unclassified Nocardia TaxID=2637762 RepID=UPI00369ED21C
MSTDNIPNGLPSALHLLKAIRDIGQQAAERGLLTDDAGVVALRDAQAHLSNGAMPHGLLAIVDELGQIEKRLGQIVDALPAGLGLLERLAAAMELGDVINAMIAGFGYPSGSLHETDAHARIRGLIAEIVSPATEPKES